MLITMLPLYLAMIRNRASEMSSFPVDLETVTFNTVFAPDTLELQFREYI